MVGVTLALAAVTTAAAVMIIRDMRASRPRICGRPFAGRARPGSAGVVRAGLGADCQNRVITARGRWSSERPRHRAPVGPGGGRGVCCPSGRPGYWRW